MSNDKEPDELYEYFEDCMKDILKTEEVKKNIKYHSEVDTPGMRLLKKYREDTLNLIRVGKGK